LAVIVKRHPTNIQHTRITAKINDKESGLESQQKFTIPSS